MMTMMDVIRAKPRRTAALAARTMLSGGLSLLVALSPVAAPPVLAASDDIIAVSNPQQKISLGLDKSKVIDLPRDAHDILVSNPKVADAVTRTARRIYIFGKQVGQTNIFVFDSAGREIAVLDLRIERDVAGLETTIRKYVPDAEVKVEILNDNIVLTGSVQTPQDASKAVRLAEIYLRGGEATTGQFLQVASGAGGSGGGGDVAFGQEDRRSSQIVNLLQIQGEDQVTLKVTVAEVQRSVIKQLGFNGVGSTVIDGIGIGAISDNPFALGKAASGAALGIGGVLGNGSFGKNNINGELNALEQAGVMKTLAEPSLTAISGESASFRVGGTFSVTDGKEETPPTETVLRDSDGNIIYRNGIPLTEKTPPSVTYKSKEIDYGIGLDFTPVVLSAGRISLKLRTAVSEPTFETPFVVPDGVAPATSQIGIRKRLADTTVELPSGGSLVIAGLVRDEQRQVISGYPGLAKVPILGTLFRSRDFQRYETELVIIVTPYLVRPVARQALARPDDNLNFSSDGASNFLGRINRVYGTTEAKLPPGRYHGIVGYIYK